MINNFGPHNPDGSLDNFTTMIRTAASENTQLNDIPLSTTYKAGSPTTMPSNLNTYPITATHLNTYTDLKTLLAPTVGAYQRLASDGSWVANRDSVDSGVIAYILNPSISPNSLISSPGALPAFLGTAAADTSGAGMPDAWKSDHGLSLSDSTVGNTIRPNANGFTNLDLYLSGLFPIGTPLP
jgi:hypothetical protein